MSLTSALYASVAGIKAQSQSLAAISENVANSGTTAYKTREMHFESLVTNGYSSASRTASGSVLYSTYQSIDQQGIIEPTGVSTNIAISGSGFFVVSDDVTNLPNAYCYTRNGDFTVDENGYLVNNEGYYLYGQTTDENGNVLATNSNDLNSLEPINVNAISGTASATTEINMDLNLPADLDTANPPTNYPYTTTIEIFDSLGISHSIDMTWNKTGVNTWTATLSDTYITGDATKTSTGTIDTGNGDNVIDLVFNGDGSLQYADGDGDGVHDAALQLSITGISASTGANDFTGTTAITLDMGTAGRSDGITQSSSNSTSPDIDISLIDQDGVRYGQLSGYEIDEDGLVTALFDNGLRQTIYQIPIATFPNAGGLTHIGGTVYDENSLAGNYNLRKPGEGKAGTIEPASLELSTTDTSEEFSKMIISQQAYSAASQVLSTTDEMFQTLIQSVS